MRDLDIELSLYNVLPLTDVEAIHNMSRPIDE